MRDCTCVGSCRGAKGLGPGWNCALENGYREHVSTDETPYEELQRLRAARIDKAKSELVVKQTALMGAASDLLAALKWLLFEVERERDYEHWQHVIDPARAAIATAEPLVLVPAGTEGYRAGR